MLKRVGIGLCELLDRPKSRKARKMLLMLILIFLVLFFALIVVPFYLLAAVHKTLVKTPKFCFYCGKEFPTGDTPYIKHVEECQRRDWKELHMNQNERSLQQHLLSYRLTRCPRCNRDTEKTKSACGYCGAKLLIYRPFAS